MSEWRGILDNPPDYGVRFLAARVSRYGEWEAEVVAWEAKGLMTSAGVRFNAMYWCPLPAPPAAMKDALDAQRAHDARRGRA